MLRACGADGAVDAAAPVHTLQFPGPWRIGRACEADIRFAAHHVSRLHAEGLEFDAGGGIVERCIRGTLVNGRPRAKDPPQPLRSGDVVEPGRGCEPWVLLHAG